MLERRVICEVCGHTREWHDRDAARARLRSDPPIERPCYREIGGAACRCGGFRDSGELAVPVGSGAAPLAATRPRVVQNAALALLLVVMALGLLYAYRSQTPAVTTVSITQAIQDIDAGRVRTVTIDGDRATLELRNGPTEQTTIAEPDTILAKAVADYNAANPSQPIELRYVTGSQAPGVIGSVVLSVLPLLLIGALFLYMARTRRTA